MEAFVCDWCGAMTSDPEELIAWDMFPSVTIPNGKNWWEGGHVCETCDGWLQVASAAAARGVEVGRWAEREKCARVGCC